MMKRLLFTSMLAVSAIAIASGCPGGGGVPKGPGGLPDRGGGKGSVDPDTCENYAAVEGGMKLRAFLEATVELNKAVLDSEAYLKETCNMMGEKLGMAKQEGDTGKVCKAVIAELQNHIKVGVKTKSALKVDYKPAVCEVNIDAAADIAAKCEGKASADVGVRCEGKCGGTCSGSCSGTCNGTCKGTCKGKAGTGGNAGKCDGQCEGTCEGSCSATCQGSCSGGCEGHADVEASAECKAKADVHANVDAKCTEPEVKVSYEAGVVVDKTKIEQAKAALEVGFGRIMMVQAKMTGPVKGAFTAWAQATKDLAGVSAKLARSLDKQAMCIGGQMSAAFGMLGNIQASVDVQVSVSAEASGSVGGG
jgi:modification target Cys-rich repeat protein